jgi:hypothetical protein
MKKDVWSWIWMDGSKRVVCFTNSKTGQMYTRSGYAKSDAETLKNYLNSRS